MFEEVFDPIDEVFDNINYWLFRTESGSYYDSFYDGGYIAMGWNYITLQDITELPYDQIREKIAKKEGYDLQDTVGLRKATTATNKLMQFKKLKKGDVILIPSSSSTKIAFGVIEDDGIYAEVDDLHEVNIYKRRSVEWYLEYPVSRLDSVFYQMTHTHHVMSNLSKYDKYIDRVMHSVYKKKGFAHIALEVRTADDVDVETLLSFVGALQKITLQINSSFGFEENVRENSIRLNIQSPGIMEMKLLKGNSLMMLAVIFNVMSCGNTENIQGTKNQKEKIEYFIESNSKILDVVSYGIDTMKIDMSRFNNIY